MHDHELQERLSIINTRWSLLRQAHRGPDDEAGRAREELMQLYHGPIYRYLLAGVRDPEVAADLSQEFAVRFLEGRFHKADPARGRFRDYLKTCLFHLVSDYRRRQGKQPPLALLEGNDPADPAQTPSAEDQAFHESWREELLSRAWRRLAEVQQDTRQPYYGVLQFRIENPDLSSSEMAGRLSVQMGKSLTADGVRQLLHRARERFADLLLEEVRRSLGPSGTDYLEDELADLNLLKYCQNALDRRAAAEG